LACLRAVPCRRFGPARGGLVIAEIDFGVGCDGLEECAPGGLHGFRPRRGASHVVACPSEQVRLRARQRCAHRTRKTAIGERHDFECADSVAARLDPPVAMRKRSVQVVGEHVHRQERGVTGNAFAYAQVLRPRERLFKKS
jgi:hypothetical protein